MGPNLLSVSKKWPIAEHNPRASWREGTEAEDMMRAAFDMQVDHIINVGVVTLEILVVVK